MFPTFTQFEKWTVKKSSFDQQTRRLNFNHPGVHLNLQSSERILNFRNLKMSVKDLENIFLSLNTEFVDLKSKIDVIIKKYEDLEYELNQRKCQFKCSNCNKKFENLSDLQDHKKEEGTCQANFKCEECGKAFRSENQLDIHKKKHVKYECEDCDFEYNYEGLLEKHNTAVHGNVKIFCHYFNNDKECPFEDQCVFAHEESPVCKFGAGCERIMCMFQHE